MFMGEYNHTIDAKGRLIVPAKFREELGEAFVITNGNDGCLNIYTEEAWETFLGKLKLLPNNRDTRSIVRKFVSQANRVEVDKQGRILIPTVLRDYADFFISCEDAVAALGMRTYAAGLDGDPAVISGESGAATLGAAVRILSDNDLAGLREEMKLNADSVILLISTEGDTDPENYRRVVCGCQNEIS